MGIFSLTPSPLSHLGNAGQAALMIHKTLAPRWMWMLSAVQERQPARKIHGVISDSHAPLKFWRRKFVHRVGMRLVLVLRAAGLFPRGHQETGEKPPGGEAGAL